MPYYQLKMKPIIKILIFVCTVLLNCNSKADKLNKFWIGYEISYLKGNRFEIIGSIGKDPLLDNPNFDSIYIDTISFSKIFNFKYDSATITIFNETLYDGYRSTDKKFKMKNDSILFLKGENNDAFSMYIEQLDKQRLTLTYKNTYNKRLDETIKLVFQPVEYFHQIEYLDALMNFLLNNIIRTSLNSTNLKFTKEDSYYSGEFFTDDLKVKFGMHNDWHIAILEEELFLILGEHIIQIKEIGSETVTGLIYGPNNEEVTIKSIK